jgi:uridine kinase
MSDSSSPQTNPTEPAVATGGGAETERPFVLGVIGDSGSGKSTVVKGVRALLGAEHVADVKLDDYQRYTRAERAERGLSALNPAVHNFPLMLEHLQLLRRGRPVRSRSYEHKDGSFGPVRVIEPKDVVVVRGLLGYPTPALRAAYDLAVFLDPEPDLLFRWKLRRDVRTRGYTEAEVLKNIAQHLLDSKEYVRPQADLADVVVRYEVEEWDAPDSAVRTAIVLRRGAAAVVAGGSCFDASLSGVQLEEQGEELVIRLGPDLDLAEVEAWGHTRFPGADWERVGQCQAEEGSALRAPMAFVQILLACLTRKLHSPSDAEREPAAVEQ